jgi:two-component system phosphate regulon sensor histidine kinase PhoR
MRNRIFRGIFCVALAVWLACLVLVMGALYTQYSQQYNKSIRNEAYIVAKAVDESGISYFSGLKLQENYRITMIDKTGKVLYDTEADVKTMGNHGNRPEIKQAMKSGYGEDTRYSKTLSQKTTYSAVRLHNGGVLRVSETQFTVLTLLISMLQPIIFVLLMAIILSFILAISISRKIVEPINKIDMEDPMATETYEEIRPLVTKIAQQNRQLNNRITELQYNVDEKTRESEFRKEFTANVSHELKTPLTSISGFAEIIRNGIVKPEDIPGFAGKIYDEAQRLITLVEDIIKISQLDENQVNAKRERIDLYSISEDVVASLEKAAETADVKVSIKGEHVFVEGVYQILEEIVYNLCDNGIKYNKTGGSLDVTIGTEGGRPYVKVADTGIGIPQSDIDRVFERFYRVNKSHSKEIGGTGLGLSIVKHGAAYHNADVRIASQLGKGTVITVLF